MDGLREVTLPFVAVNIYQTFEVNNIIGSRLYAEVSLSQVFVT